jgi:hypothetical protein
VITWQKQESAIVGTVPLSDGTEAKAVIVGPRDNPKGAVLVLPAGEDNQVSAAPLASCLDRIDPKTLVEILCAQERQFGSSDLPTVIES